MRKITRKGLVRKLDTLVSSIVRSKGKCERCGKKENLQCAHIYSRRYKHLRWDLQNVVCLCAGCHFWAHQNPTEFAFWVETIRNVKYLQKQRQISTPIKMFELEDLYKELSKLDPMNDLL